MARKQPVNKTQAVRDYLKAHPEAKSGEIAAALTKQGIKINAGHVANIKTKINKEGRKAKKPAKKEAPVETPVVVEKPSKPGDTITLEQIRTVAQTVKAMGGFQKMVEVLEVIKSAGGVKKFKDLAEAITCPAPKTPDEIPF